jgi:hypothetical protein
MVLLDPEPHSATMLKPFHRSSTPEFCSSCHKVHLDVPVNSYRWFRGFNDYDPWQQSGVSGQGARAFYYPPDGPKKCGSCHMPLVASQDKGNVDGKVHSHRFPAANTALPFVNRDEAQLETVKKFLQDGILTVDIFAVSEEPDDEDAPGRREAEREGRRAPRGDERVPRGCGVGRAGVDASRRGRLERPSRGRRRAREVIAPLERASAAAPARIDRARRRRRAHPQDRPLLSRRDRRRLRRLARAAGAGRRRERSSSGTAGSPTTGAGRSIPAPTSTAPCSSTITATGSTSATPGRREQWPTRGSFRPARRTRPTS